MRQFLGTLLGNREIAFFEIGEQISTAELLHDDVDVVLVLEDVQQTDDVRVLAHLEDLDLTPLQFDVLD